MRVYCGAGVEGGAVAPRVVSRDVFHHMTKTYSPVVINGTEGELGGIRKVKK